MFVVELFKENPELVKSQLSSILRNRANHARYFEASQVGADGIVFKVENPCDYDYILVSDFEICNQTGNEVSNPKIQNKQWRRFMINMFGQEYFEAFMRQRAKQKKAFVEEYNKETEDMVYDLTKYAKCDIGHNR